MENIPLDLVHIFDLEGIFDMYEHDDNKSWSHQHLEQHIFHLVSPYMDHYLMVWLHLPSLLHFQYAYLPALKISEMQEKSIELSKVQYASTWTKLILRSPLTLWAPIPQNVQTHSNNSPGNCQRIVWVCLAILLIWRLKG